MWVYIEQWYACLCIYKVPLRDVCDVKSRGCRKLMKRDMKKVTQQKPQLIYVEGNMVKETAGQEFLLTTIIYFEHYIIPVRTAILLSTINYFEHYTRTYSCGSQVKDQPLGGHIFDT